MSKSILPVFSSRRFKASDLSLKSLIHFEFIFVCNVRKQSSLILLHQNCAVFPKPLIEETTPYQIFLHPLLQINCPCKCEFISGLSHSVPLTYISVSLSVSHCLDDCILIGQSEIRECDTSNFASFLRLFWIFESFAAPYTFQNSLFQSVENATWYFDQNCIKPADCLAEYGHFHLLILPVHGHSTSFHPFVLSSVSVISLIVF